MPKYKNVYALKSANDYSIGELTLTDSNKKPSYDSTTGKVFDKAQLEKLYSALTGGAGTTLQDVANTVSGTHSTQYGYAGEKVNLPEYKTAAELFELNDNGNIVVELNGQEFAVSFLTTAKVGGQNHVIATLWMTQPLVDGNKAVTDKFGWATTNYSVNYTADIGESYISNAYSTSLLRMKVLNAGSTNGTATNYAMSDTANDDNVTTLDGEVTKEERLKNVLAPFTLDNSALTGTNANKSLIEYLVTPSQVEYTYYLDWPYEEEIYAGASYLLNEALTNPMHLSTTAGGPSTIFYANRSGSDGGYWWNQGVLNYVTSTENRYNDWGNDYVWLPSLSETGYSAVDGLWGTGLGTTGQIRFNNENVTISSVLGEVVNDECIWLRSGTYPGPDASAFLSSSGVFYWAFTVASLAVRPALHFDLTAADAAAATVVATPGNDTVTTEYNGTSQALKSIASVKDWYDNTFYTSNSVSVSQDSFTDAGTYNVIVSLNSSDYVWSDFAKSSAVSRNFTVTVEKKKLAISYDYNDDGYLVASFENEDEIYSRDTGDKYPNLITKYYEDGDSTDTAKELTSAGLTTGVAWCALAVIDNDCNYEVSDSTKSSNAFTVSKKKLDYPEIMDDAPIPYDSKSHTYTFTGFDSSTMKYTVSDNADSFDGTTLTVTNAGEYTVKFTLTDTENYEWRDSAVTYTLTVKPREVMITLDEDAIPDPWTIEKGSSFDITVYAQSPYGDELEVYAVYENENGKSYTLVSVNNGDGTHTVTIPATLGRGNYTLVINVSSDTPNYVAYEEIERTFAVTAQGLDLDESDLVWKIGSTKYSYGDLTDGVLVLEYTGSSIAPVLDTTQNWFVDYSVESYGGTTSATDVNDNEYEITVHIVARNSEEYSFDKTFSLKYKIVPKVIDFTNAVWEWQYDGDSSWTLFSSGKPAFANRAVDVRISHSFLSSLGLADGDYTESYINNDNLTEQGNKSTTGAITITNSNFTTADGTGYFTMPYNWEITAKAISYTWGVGTLVVDGKAYDIPAVVFADGGDYSQYYEYVYNVNGEQGDFTEQELIDYISDNLTDNSTISGTVSIRLLQNVTEVNIISSSRPFTTGTPKTPIAVEVSGSGEYGRVNFIYTAQRNGSDERERTEVTVSGTAYSGEIVEQTFDGTSSELAEFVNKLGAGDYVITLALTGTNGNSYALSQYSFAFEISKCRIELPTVPEIIYNGGEQSLENLLIGYNADLMELSGITSQTRHGTNSATVTLLDTGNYEFVKTTTAGGATTVKYSLADEEEETESVETIGGSYDFDWTIEKFVITQDMWDLSGKSGASIKLPSEFNALLADESALKFTYSYYTEQNGQPLEEGSYSFKGGNSFFVSAELSGSEADNFVFENGTLTSDKTVYTVPQSAVAAFMSKTLDYVKNNLALVIGCALGLLLLILLIIIIAAAVKRKKRRDAEKKEEKKLEREERMMRMQMGGGMPAGAQMPMTAAGMIAAQQAQQPMPQPQPLQPTYQQPVQQPQMVQTPAPQTYDGGAIARIEAELAAIREEQKNKTEAELANARLLVEFERLRGDMKQLGGAVNFNGQQSGVHNAAIPADVVIALLEAVKNGNVAPVTITNAPAPAAIPQSVEESAAQPVMAQYPSDAVITTTTTVDTTQKPTRKAERENKRGAKSERSEFSDIDGFYDNADY